MLARLQRHVHSVLLGIVAGQIGVSSRNLLFAQSLTDASYYAVSAQLNLGTVPFETLWSRAQTVRAQIDNYSRAAFLGQDQAFIPDFNRQLGIYIGWGTTIVAEPTARVAGSRRYSARVAVDALGNDLVKINAWHESFIPEILPKLAEAPFIAGGSLIHESNTRGYDPAAAMIEVTQSLSMELN